MLRTLSSLALALLIQIPAPVPPTPGPPAPGQEVDSALQALTERFFSTQQAEDVDAYLALWSRSASKPTAEQLRFVFASGDDLFTEVSVVRASVIGETARIRVGVTRARTDARSKNPDGSARVFTTRLQLALALVREEGEWRIVREGGPVDELATALIATDDPELRRQLLEAEPELITPRLTDAISRRADQLVQVTQYKAAQLIYERSLEVARVMKNARAEGQALQNIANSQYFQRNFSAALKSYELRLALARETNNDDGAASALVGIGTVLYTTYDYGAALKTYREALAIQETLNDLGPIGTTLISTGNVLYLQGDYAAAIADYRRAEELKRKALDPGGAASALEGLGRVYSAQGDYAEALHAFAGVLDERRASNDGPRQALVLHSIGEIHFRLGNTDAARAAYQESRQLFEKAKDLGSAGRALQGAALTELVAGRYPAAEKAYTESIAACTTGKDPECIARAQVGLAYALAAQEKFDDAVTWYTRSLIAFNELGMEDAGARARLGLAEALYGRGDYEKALEQAVAARRTAVALETDDVLWRALVSVARTERKLAKPDLALGSARAAVQTVVRMATAAFDRPGQAAPADSATAYAALAVIQAEQGDAAAAFNTVETMRAHSLRVVLAGSERDIARGMTNEERAEEHRLATVLTTLLAQRTSQRSLPKPDAASLAKLELAIKEATAERAAAREKLFARLPDLPIWRGLGPVATGEDLPTLLDTDGQALLQFLVDEHDVLMLLASRKTGQAGIVQKAYVAPVKRHDLAQRIVRAMDGNALASVERWRTASKDLFSILPPEVVDEISAATSVVIVPDDTLWRVPYEALPIRDRYLADRAALTYATSVTAAIKPPSNVAPLAAAPRIAAVAAPVLTPTLVEDLKATAPTWTLRSPESASLEVAAIKPALKADAAGPVLLTGLDATKRAAADAAAAADALHIAAPFRINSASPLFSRVLLSEPPAEKPVHGKPPAGIVPTSRDTQLDAREVFNLQSAARVVFLSDPATLAMRDASRGIPAIHWAWRATGSATMILKRWGFSDSLSNQVVSAFYEEMAGGKTPEQALEAARAAVRKTEGGRAPAAWAGWIVITGR